MNDCVRAQSMKRATRSTLVLEFLAVRREPSGLPESQSIQLRLRAAGGAAGGCGSLIDAKPMVIAHDDEQRLRPIQSVTSKTSTFEKHSFKRARKLSGRSRPGTSCTRSVRLSEMTIAEDFCHQRLSARGRKLTAQTPREANSRKCIRLKTMPRLRSGDPRTFRRNLKDSNELRSVDGFRPQPQIAVDLIPTVA